MIELTGRTQEVYSACIQHTATHHNFPTLRWLIDHTDITSTSMVVHYLNKLEELKLIKRISRKKTGSWKITGAIWMPPIDAPLPSELYNELLENFIYYSLKVPMGKEILKGKL
jgi:hypothetical protein